MRCLIRILLINLCFAFTSGALFAEWYSPEKTGRISGTGDEYYDCLLSEWSPKDIIEFVVEKGGTYRVSDERVDDTTGEITSTYLVLNLPSEGAAHWLFFRSLSQCRLVVGLLDGMKLDRLDRY